MAHRYVLRCSKLKRKHLKKTHIIVFLREIIKLYYFILFVIVIMIYSPQKIHLDDFGDPQTSPPAVFISQM